MARPRRKTDLPVSEIRRYLEPGPIVLVTSAHGDERNIMTIGWHTVMEFTPSLIGCVMVVGVGNTSGAEIDKFEKFKLTRQKAQKVNAPLIAECHANFECRLADGSLISKYNFFIFEVVKAHVVASPKHPETLHYTGDGVWSPARSSAADRSSGRECCRSALRTAR